MFEPRYRKDPSFHYPPDRARQEQRHNYKLILLNPLFWGPPLIVGLLAVLSPGNVLDLYPMLAQFCDAMVQQFPFLGKHKSQFSQVTRLVLCVSFAALIPQLAGTWLLCWQVRHIHINRVRAGIVPIPGMSHIFIAPFFLALVFWAFWYYPGDPWFCKSCTTGNSFGLGLLASLSIVAVPATIVYPIFIFYTMVKLPKHYE